MVIGDDLFLFKDPSAQSKEEMAGDPMPADEAWQEYVSLSLTQSQSVSVLTDLLVVVLLVVLVLLE